MAHNPTDDATDDANSPTTFTVDLLNFRYSPDEQFIVEHCSGYAPDHSDDVLDLVDEPHDCECGNWVVVVDGEVVEDGEFCPSHIHYEA